MGNTRYENIPFLRIIAPAAVGLIAAYFIDLPVWLAAVACIICIIISAASRNRGIWSVYTMFAIMFFFLTMAVARAPKSRLPEGERVAMIAQIVENPYQRGRWAVTTADAGYYNDSLRQGGQWKIANERVQLYIDSGYDITTGQQIAFNGWINPIDTTESSYGNLMKMRGMHNRVYLVQGNLIRIAPHTSHTPAYFAGKMQQGALERLDRLDIPAKELSVVKAMTAGDKREIPRELRSDYSSTGAAHLLAVSGLHVGIVFMLINILLYLLPIFSQGHIARNAIAIIAIWAYAMMAGLSPSVVRAALMFSFAQMALGTSSSRNSLNIMLGSAVVMLAINPNYAGDPSFLLSYTAVLSILMFFRPLFRLVRSRYKLLNAFASVIIVGITASLGTAPLVAYWFGNLPVAGILINPVVILTAHVIVLCGVVWVIAPLGFMNALFSWVAGGAAYIQNSAIEWSSSLGWASVPIKMPLWAVLSIYTVYLVVAAIMHSRDNKPKEIVFN